MCVLWMICYCWLKGHCELFKFMLGSRLFLYKCEFHEDGDYIHLICVLLSPVPRIVPADSRCSVIIEWIRNEFNSLSWILVCFLEWEKKEIGLNPQSFFSTAAWSKCCIYILVMITMVLDYHLKMVRGFLNMFAHGSMNVHMNVGYHLCCVQMFEGQMVADCCISPPFPFSLWVVGGCFLLLSLCLTLAAPFFPNLIL